MARNGSNVIIHNNNNNFLEELSNFNLSNRSLKAIKVMITTYLENDQLHFSIAIP